MTPASPGGEPMCGCGRPLTYTDELESGLCLRCLNGGPPGRPGSERDERRARAEADFDAKYRRCEEHNWARYWCGCYYRARAEALRGEGR